MSNLSPEHDDSDKSIRKILVKDIVKDLVNSKMSNGRKVTNGEFNKQLERIKDICPTITRNMINRAMNAHWTSLKSLMDEDECAVVSNKDNDTNTNLGRDRGGRLIGTTIVYKHESELRRVKVHNDVNSKYAVEKRLLSYGKMLPRGRLNEIIEDFTSKHGLETSDVSSFTIRKRETQYNDTIVTRLRGGHILPITKVGDKLVGLIIQMARIGHPLTPSSCLQLANGFISGTQTEKDVINFKTKSCFTNSKDDERLLGRG